MIRRTTDPRYVSFHRYGGRGITVHPEWRASFAAFLAHIGPRPSSKYSLDRLDNNRGYEPGNVAWRTKREQQQNRSTNLNLTARGETLCVTEWARRLGMPVTTLQRRIQLGWSAERAISTPVDSRRSSRRAARSAA